MEVAIEAGERVPPWRGRNVSSLLRGAPIKSSSRTPMFRLRFRPPADLFREVGPPGRHLFTGCRSRRSGFPPGQPRPPARGVYADVEQHPGAFALPALKVSARAYGVEALPGGVGAGVRLCFVRGLGGGEEAPVTRYASGRTVRRRRRLRGKAGAAEEGDLPAAGLSGTRRGEPFSSAATCALSCADLS